MMKKNENSHNSLIKFIFVKKLKCVCVEMKSIWKSSIFILFFFQTTKSFLQEKKVLCQTFILFNQATERQNHFFTKNEKFGGGSKNFSFLNNLKNS